MMLALLVAASATLVVLGLAISVVGPWVALSGVAFLAAAYFAVIRPWHLAWGATEAEAKTRYPGDTLVPGGRNVTRAVECHAPPRAVWPWLVQMGQGRGGFYSYDFLENLAGLRVHNVDRIVPEWQQVDAGDLIPFTPDGFGMRVVRIEPERTLVLAATIPTPGDARLDESTVVWGFHLTELAGGRTRLVVRLRTPDPLARPIGWGAATFLLFVLEPLHFLMEQRMLRGIRSRAERLAMNAPRLA